MAWRSRWLFGWAFVACSSAQALQGAGGPCLLVSDCKLGLVCVPRTNGPNQCSDKLDGLVSNEDAGTTPGAVRSSTGDSGGGPDVVAPPVGDDAAIDAGAAGIQDAPASPE